ncbi:class I SAM-dependent methyltransferase [Crocosphaera chwakensis]|uniref:tRNA (Guanine-N(2)-)-methyltransferase n=1 Tax=Crocosphaera chwakensis CCY0110 TaxID=391612 RepID=A3ITR3_9CHRO|nr:tRNA (guanine-N1)-methyltransferase [Crocosphaera chwakensis]EAZ90129.1 tRNA (guanine-N(2)-)-methyltransferase [Crocosphaera chwakensis CCY0110]
MNHESLICEEKAYFIVGNTFYRSQSKITRDLGVLAAKAYKNEQGKLKVLDVMTGCGVRSLRYYLESDADYILANDSNPENKAVIEHNLSQILQEKKGKVTYQNANNIFFECYSNKDYYDFVDVDAFGSPNPYLSTALWATKIGGLIYLTCTDGRTATGHLPENCLQVYGSYGRSHPAAQEQVLRLIIGSTLQQAATIGLGIEPIFSYFSGQTYRVMLRLLPKINLSLDNYGFLGYCHHCGEYVTISYKQLGKMRCYHQQENKKYNYTISGAMWLGDLHNKAYLKTMKSLVIDLKWTEVSDLLSTMINESEFPPYFYTLGEIGRRGKLDIPKRSQLIKALHNQGFSATNTHINSQAIKTNATLKQCIEIAKGL